jgi:hypothetical protein
MREEVGIEDEQRQGDEGCGGREHFTRGGEDDQAEEQRENCGGHAGPKEDAVEVIAEEEVASAEEGVVLEEAALERGHVKGHAEQWCRGGHLHQRRDFGIEAVISGRKREVAGIEMMSFVPCDGVAARGER